jgi:hypothetical protein
MLLIEAGKVPVMQSTARENAPDETGQRVPALDGSFPTRRQHGRQLLGQLGKNHAWILNRLRN